MNVKQMIRYPAAFAAANDRLEIKFPGYQATPGSPGCKG